MLRKLMEPAPEWQPAFDSDYTNPLKMSPSEVFELNIESDKYLADNEAFSSDDVDERFEYRI